MLPHAIRLAALVPVLAGAAGALTGAGFLGEPAGPATGSHMRYLSGLLLALGAAAAWCAGDLRRRAGVFDSLCAAVAVGGVARLGGVAAEGLPPLPHLLALGMELGVTPALWLWSRRVPRRHAGPSLESWLRGG
jgi:hypothetical protein